MEGKSRVPSLCVEMITVVPERSESHNFVKDFIDYVTVPQYFKRSFLLSSVKTVRVNEICSYSTVNLKLKKLSPSRTRNRPSLTREDVKGDLSSEL